MELNESIVTEEAPEPSIFDDDESIDMEIGAEAQIMVMSMLSSLYKNPSLAVAREVTSNAIDATVESGTDRPIELTLPSYYSPTFTVKDYGHGISRKKMAEVFSKYGITTKTEIKEQMGGFGLGAKSPFAISDTFTIISICEGKETIWLAKSGDPARPPKVTIVSEEETDAPTGVTIKVPVKNFEVFNESIKGFLFGMDNSKILVNGESYEDNINNSELWTKVGENGYVNLKRAIKSTSYTDELSVIIGSVMYKINRDSEGVSDLLSRYGKNNTYRNAIVRVPIKAIHLAPNRDDIRFTEHTVKTLTQIFDDFNDVLIKEMEETFEKLTTAVEAMKFYEKILTPLKSQVTTWHGIGIKNFIAELNTNVFSQEWTRGSADSASYNSLNLLRTVNSFSNRFIILFNPATSEQDIVRRNMKDMLRGLQYKETGELKEDGEAHIVFVPTTNESLNVSKDVHSNVWVNGVYESMTVDDVKKGALEYRRAVRAYSLANKKDSGEPKATPYISYIKYGDTGMRFDGFVNSANLNDYEYHVVEGESALIDAAFKENKKTSKYYFNEGSSQVRLRRALEALNIEKNFIYVPQKVSFKKFLSLSSASEKFVELVEKKKEEAVTNATSEDIFFLQSKQKAQTSDLRSWWALNDFPEERLKDIVNVETREVIRALQSRNYTTHEKNLLFLQSLGLFQDVVFNLEAESSMKTYPLLKSNGSRDYDHAILYINAVG